MTEDEKGFYRMFPIAYVIRWVYLKFKREKIKVVRPKGYDPSQDILSPEYSKRYEIVVETESSDK